MFLQLSRGKGAGCCLGAEVWLFVRTRNKWTHRTTRNCVGASYVWFSSSRNEETSSTAKRPLRTRVQRLCSRRQTVWRDTLRKGFLDPFSPEQQILTPDSSNTDTESVTLRFKSWRFETAGYSWTDFSCLPSTEYTCYSHFYPLGGTNGPLKSIMSFNWWSCTLFIGGNCEQGHGQEKWTVHPVVQISWPGVKKH